MSGRSQEVRHRRLRKLASSGNKATTVLYGRRYLADYPDDGFAWSYVADALIDLGRYEEAEQANAKAIELCPDRIRQIGLARKGHLFEASGDFDQAAEWFRRAIAADPGDAKYHTYLGTVLAKQGRLIEAEDEFRTATHCCDGPPEEAHYNLACVLITRERFDEAAECLWEALKIAPDYREAKRALRDVELCLKLRNRRS